MLKNKRNNFRDTSIKQRIETIKYWSGYKMDKKISETLPLNKGLKLSTPSKTAEIINYFRDTSIKQRIETKRMIIQMIFH